MGWIAGLAAAAVAAYGQYSSAQAANKPKKGYTDQTTTQVGNYANELQPDFRQVMELMRGNIAHGPQYIPGGHLAHAEGDWPTPHGGGDAGPPQALVPDEQPQLPGSDQASGLSSIASPSQEAPSSLPAGARRMGDRVILASGETQGMSKAGRHRAWMDWKASRGAA
jgi:hypothetical protein